jgi:hypothetical protein
MQTSKGIFLVSSEVRHLVKGNPWVSGVIAQDAQCRLLRHDSRRHK